MPGGDDNPLLHLEEQVTLFADAILIFSHFIGLYDHTNSFGKAVSTALLPAPHTKILFIYLFIYLNMFMRDIKYNSGRLLYVVL